MVFSGGFSILGATTISIVASVDGQADRTGSDFMTLDTTGSPIITGILPEARRLHRMKREACLSSICRGFRSARKLSLRHL